MPALSFVGIFKHENIKNRRLIYSNICSTNVYYKLMMDKALSGTYQWDSKPQDSVENLSKLTPQKMAVHIHDAQNRPCVKSTYL